MAISHLYTSRFNQDKKLLAFTDSVQDASHRAAFFGARTYRFNLRTAIQATLRAADPVRLSDFATAMLGYWRAEEESANPDAMPDPDLVATLMPPDLIEHPPYRAYMANPQGSIPPKLTADLLKRLSWEVTMEYGHMSRVGRTLEKTACSAAAVEAAILQAAVGRAAEVLPEQFVFLRDAKQEDLHHFIQGMLTRSRTRGGVAHPMLKRYAEEFGKWFQLTRRQQPLLSVFGPDSRLPRFLTDEASADVFDSIITGAQPGWFFDWARRCLGALDDRQIINDLYRALMPLLAETGVLTQYTKGRLSAWAIRPEALEITAQVAVLSCRACRHTVCVPADQEMEWKSRSCLNFRCEGQYGVADVPAQSYYRHVYLSGAVQRIFTQEHTGLLEGEKRHEVEIGFKERNRPDAPNLLACTPTLEMGIDIGDLSATMACSVPPSTARYLQRIGRSGRASGNSNVLVVANTRPHDLYFFEQPEEMMSGAIQPPGCYLDAVEMLKRQYVAHCMDNWAFQQPAGARIPQQVRNMLASFRRGEFPESFLRYQDEHNHTLTSGFTTLFKGVVSPSNEDEIRKWVASGGVRRQLVKALDTAEGERTRLRNLRNRLTERIRKIEAEPHLYDAPEEEKEALGRERSLILQLIRRVDEQYSLNLFTDHGVLPNYAFPETGVTLEAMIWGIRPPDESGEAPDRQTESHKWLRPSSEAIRELAPFNTFYAESRRVQIDQVDTGGLNNSLVEEWHFCPECPYMEREVEDTRRKACPVCGNTGWEDTGQVRKLLRLTKVSANEHTDRSRTDDTTEDRERKQYEMVDFISVLPENCAGAFANLEIPFGYEYLTHVTMRQVNFGPQEASGNRIRVVGSPVSEAGFVLCADCGRVQTPRTLRFENRRDRHRFHCVFNQPGREEQWRDVNLYRELSSDAVRVLLPVSTFQHEESVATFAACLDLGLREKFGGRPIHILIREQSDPAGGEEARRRYLVLYDTVPGGTGYLKNLVTRGDFMDVLQLALNALLTCRCNQAAADGCYRCLLAYQRQYDLPLISRRLGVEMLEKILAGQNDMQEIETLGRMDVHGLVESELEARFLAALEHHATETPGWAWAGVLRNSKACHRLEVEGRRWVIEPQVLLDPSLGVREQCRGDFVIWPEVQGPDVLPVAVFADGLEYHVRPSEQHGEVAEDLRKRLSIRASGKFAVWSLTWRDVTAFESERTGSPFLGGRTADKVGEVLRALQSPVSTGIARSNAMTALMEYLKHPESASWRKLGAGVALAILSAGNGKSASAEWCEARAAKVLSQGAGEAPGSPTEPGSMLVGEASEANLAAMAFGDTDAARSLDPQGLSAVLYLHDSADCRADEAFEKAWRQFLAGLNLLQFLPRFAASTTEHVELYEAPALPEAPMAAPEAVVEVTDLDLCDERCRDVVVRLAAQGTAAPTVGYELVGPDNRILAEAEVAWKEQQVAVLVEAQADGSEAFQSAGWTVIDVHDATEERLAELLSSA